MIGEHILLALLKSSDARTSADIELIASFCRLFSVFNEIPEHLYNAFCRIIEIEEYDSGSIIYNQEEIGSDWYVIVEGSVSVVSNSSSTNPIRGVLKIGDSLGRSALNQDITRGETVTCLEHVYVLRVSRRSYQEMLSAANSGSDGDIQSFANDFLKNLYAIPGMNIATSIYRKVFPSNTIIISQNSESDGVYFILKGTAAVVRKVSFLIKKDNYIEKLIEIDELFSGSIFGLRSHCTNEKENVSVISKSELTVYFLSRADFFRKVDSQKQKESLISDYPDDNTIKKLFQKQMKWEKYKKKVVKEVLQHKKAKKELKLQY